MKRKNRGKVNLIVGGTSFIGKMLASRLSRKGERVFSTYQRKRKKDLKSAEGVRFLPCDVTNKREITGVIRRVRPDCIYYLAAQGSVRKSWLDPAGTIDVNFSGGLYAMDALRDLGLDSKFVVFSSGVAYGESHLSGKKLREEACLRPKEPYGLSKLAIDFLARMYAKVFGIHAIILRLVNLVGPGQSVSFSLSNFAYQIAGIEAGKLEPVLRVGNLESRRDYLDIRDALRAMDAAIARGGKGGVYNVGSGKTRLLGDILNDFLCLSHLGKGRVKIIRNLSLSSKDEIPSMCLDASRLRRLSGWRPEISFRETLKNILDYWRAHWNET